MLGQSAASKITYVRPVGGPENTSNSGENPNINSLAWPPRPSPEPLHRFFLSKNYLWHIFGSEFWQLLGHFRLFLGQFGQKQRKLTQVQLLWKEQLNVPGRVEDWRVPNPPGANPLVAERAFCAGDYLNVTRVSHVQGTWQESVGISNTILTEMVAWGKSKVHSFLGGHSFSIACSQEIVGLQNVGFPTKLQRNRPNRRWTKYREHAC